MPQYELNIRDYIRVLRKRQAVVVVTFVVTVLWGGLFLLRQPSVYQASTTVKILERKSIAGLLTEWIVYDPANMMASQARMITGFPVARKVALRLGFIDKNTPVEDVDRAVVDLQGQIVAEIVGNTNLIKITATADSAQGAMDLANMVGQVYVEENLMEKRKQASTARVFIEEQLGELEQRLKEGEERLKSFNKEATELKMVSPIQEKLVNLQFELGALLQKYTEQHPRVVQLQEQIHQLEKQLEGLSSQDLKYAGMLREVEVNRKLFAMLKEKLEEARITEAQKVEDVSIVDPAILPHSPVSSQKPLRILISALGGLLLGIALAFSLETMDTSVGTLEEVEKLLKLPILGIVPLTTGGEEDAPKTLSDWAKYYLRRFNPVHPEVLDERQRRLIVHLNPTSPIAEAYRNIRTNLKLGPQQKTILVTSAGPREGKSTITINLGLAFAQKGLKTLLVSSDLRRPVMAKTFGVSREPGFNEVITGAVSLDEGLKSVYDMMMGDMPFSELVKSSSLGNLWLLPTGHITINPSELLESPEFPRLMQELRNRFDIIFFDSPPVLSITDASLLTPKVDVVILVYEVGKTARRALLRAKNQIDLVGGNISGVILNHITADSETLDSYPYYSSRYRYRENEKSSPEKPSKT